MSRARHAGGSEESVRVMIAPGLPALSRCFRSVGAGVVSLNVTASGGVPAVVADLDPVPLAEPPAERTADRVTA